VGSIDADLDVLSALEYPRHNHTKILLKLDSIEILKKPIRTNSYAINLVSESGLFKLIMRSDKPQAKPFQDWVTKVVLPAIRKDGMY
jgi:prophage antirepressor-like protein